MTLLAGAEVYLPIFTAAKQSLANVSKWDGNVGAAPTGCGFVPFIILAFSDSSRNAMKATSKGAAKPTGNGSPVS